MNEQQSARRGQWSGRLGFVLAAAGGAVGLGNLWKFPYITLENHGGAFVLIYLAAVVMVGAPIMIAEILIGRRAAKDPVGSFRTLAAGTRGARLWPGVGVLGVITGFVILSYYTAVTGWTLRYILMALSGQLGELAMHPGALDAFFGRFLADGGQQVLCYLLFMAATVGVVYFGVARGIERVSFVLMPFLFLILIAMVVYSTFTPGFGKAMAFLFRPNFAELSRGAVLEALGHSFFTLSLGMGAMLTYGSYMRKRDSIPRAAVTICVVDTLVALAACVVMFSIIFSFDMEPRRSSTILFTTLPVVFFKMPGGAAISAFFYLLVAFAALTSTISLLEVISSFAIDELGWKRPRAVLTLGAATALFGLLSALSFGSNGRLSSVNLIGRTSTEGIFGTLDYLASNWLLPVGGFLIALFAGWAMSRGDTQAELEAGHGRVAGYGAWRFLIRFAAPLAVGAIIVSVILGREYQ